MTVKALRLSEVPKKNGAKRGFLVFCKTNLFEGWMAGEFWATGWCLLPLRRKRKLEAFELDLIAHGA
jgi:hypothetical protein